MTYDKYRNIKTKEAHQILLNSGMFWEFHPELSGEWEKDKYIINKLPGQTGEKAIFGLTEELQSWRDEAQKLRAANARLEEQLKESVEMYRTCATMLAGYEELAWQAAIGTEADRIRIMDKLRRRRGLEGLWDELFGANTAPEQTGEQQ